MDALIAEDHAALSKAFSWALRRILPGWDVQTTDSGRTAEYVLIMDRDIKLALLDYLLPHADAAKIVKAVLAVRPQLRGKIIVSSGILEYPEDVSEYLFGEAGCHQLDKPVDFDELERVVLQITA